MTSKALIQECSGQQSKNTTSKSKASVNAKTTTSFATTRLRCSRIENCVVIWADRNIDLNNSDCQNTIANLRGIVNQVNPYTTLGECIEWLNENKEETVFIITSGALGQQLVSEIYSMPTLAAVYIFCGDKQRHKAWAKKWMKIKGIHTAIKPICKALQLDVMQCNQDNISVSIIGMNEDVSMQNLNQLDSKFIYSQMLKETLLEMKHDQQAVKDLINYCKEEYQSNIQELKIIDEFERTYHVSDAIWWYTRECFISKMLNRALRTFDGNLIVRIGFFVCDTHQQIDNLYKKQIHQYHGKIFRVYRGQGLSTANFIKLSRNIGGLISFNNFLSVSTKRNFALGFAEDALVKHDMIGILFQMSIDPTVSSTPFASIPTRSYFKKESEILFSMPTIFRIGNIRKLDNTRPLYQIELKLTANDNKQLREFIKHIRDDVSDATNWHLLGLLLMKMGQFDKVEELYMALIEQKFNDCERAVFYEQLGSMKWHQGHHKEAMVFNEESIKIYQNTIPKDDPSLVAAYYNIGGMYNNMGDYAKALEFYHKAHRILEKTLDPYHHHLAKSYNNIGAMYNSMGDYLKALEFYDKAHKILEHTLHSYHPDLATSYNNIGLLYDSMSEYSKALQYHKKALRIREKALPPNHPDLPGSYNNIGLLYNNIGDYSKALGFYEKALTIYESTLPLDHPLLSISYNNIGLASFEQGHYSTALSYLEKALAIRQKSFPESHPLIQQTIDNVDHVKKRM
ncbi:unnamed protein product [Rotaria socialis]|uniref:Uncharacterized protein n=1 Tax=Rotaria socialis TaxID=392032 RepID=A0A818D0D2_9BILA|nr:unnamed protein product [Rotaria socialis]CAF4662920.1 unnamed protein product [Rotaria socialis]